MNPVIAYSDRWIALAAVIGALAVVVHGWVRREPAGGRDSTLTFWLLAAAAFIAILLPVAGYWVGGRTHANAIGGLLPWNDAAGYFNCARTVIDGGPLDSFCQRRPHYSGYLTGLFALTGERLQLTLLLQAGIIAIATFLFVRLLSKRWGFAAALMGLATIAAFAGEYSITTLTENLGLPLGLVAVAFLLAGAQSQRTGVLAFGAFLLAVAINARAGAFFVLPFLVLWPLVLGDLGRAARIRLAAILLVSIAAGFVVGPVLSTLLGGDPGTTHANFSYTIYGIAAGGKGWLHIYQVHPDLVAKSLSEAERAANVYGVTWELFIDRPDLTLQGLLKGFLKYLERILKYVPWLPVRVVVVLCWLVGVVAIVRRRRTPEASLLGLMALGIALSAPILAFDAGLRIYAATIAVDAAIVAFGGSVIVSRLVRRRAPPDPVAARWPVPGRALWGFAMALLLAVFALPIALRTGAAPATFAAPQPGVCAAGEIAVPARLGRSSPVLHVVPSAEAQAWPVSPAADTFVERVDRYTFGALGFQETDAGTTYINAYDLSDVRFGQTFVALAQSVAVPADGNMYTICVGDWPDAPLDGVRRLTSVHPIPN